MMKKQKVPKKTTKNTSFHSFIERFRAHKMAQVGLIVLIIISFSSIFLPIIMDLDPKTSDFNAFDSPPTKEHLLGTDLVGRDLFARLLYGGRISLLVGVLSTMVSVLIGLPLGVLAGFYRGWVETIIMRLADIFMSFPGMIIILVLVSVFGSSLFALIVVLGFLGWASFARQAYSSTLQVRELEYVQAARAIGSNGFTIIKKYLVPNIMAPILVSFTFKTASSILTESSLSFLGMGVRPPAASWGNILFDAQSITVLSTKPWMWLPAGIAIVLTVLSFNFLGDGIRDALDPKIKI